MDVIVLCALDRARRFPTWVVYSDFMHELLTCYVLVWLVALSLTETLADCPVR